MVIFIHRPLPLLPSQISWAVKSGLQPGQKNAIVKKRTIIAMWTGWGVLLTLVAYIKREI